MSMSQTKWYMYLSLWDQLQLQHRATHHFSPHAKANQPSAVTRFPVIVLESLQQLNWACSFFSYCTLSSSKSSTSRKGSRISGGSLPYNSSPIASHLQSLQMVASLLQSCLQGGWNVGLLNEMLNDFNWTISTGTTCQASASTARQKSENTIGKPVHSQWWSADVPSHFLSFSSHRAGDERWDM